MAQVLNKDPITYQKERDGFLRELQHFHETRGTPFRRVPQINGQEIDLYLLYVLVTAHGGWLKVNSKNGWDELMDQFRLPQRCVNSGVALKQVYLRYVDRYEKVHFLGEDGGRASDDDDDSRHKRWSARALHAVPLVYNSYQHLLSETQRVYHGLSTDLYKPSDYDRLAMSLMSPLPNEQDFAINVCTLLSNEGKHTLKLDKCPRLVDFLLAHAAVFNNEGTRQLFQETYGKVRHSSMTHFWADVLEDAELHHLADETQWPLKSKTSHISNCLRTDSSSITDKTRNSSRETCESESDSEEDECGLNVGYPTNVFVGRRKRGESSKTDRERVKQKPRIEIEPSDLELFCLGRTLGTQDYLGQRVLQVATILRNLSFGEENQTVLASNPTFLRFLSLCLGSRWDSLKQLGLDALGNIASELPLERLSSDALLQLILSGVTQRLFGQDRAGIIAALEILNKLGQREDNEDAMQRSLDGKVYEQIIRYLTLHDIMLLVQTLECLYSLSSLGERACNYIVRVHGAVDTLVSLITVEAQSYGPKACILMRVVETISGHESSGHSNNLTVMQPAAPHTDHTQAGHSVTQHTGPVPIKKVFPVSPMMSKATPIRPAFTTVQTGSGSPVVTLHPQLALQQQNPQQPTMFPPSSQSSTFPTLQSVQTSMQSLQPQQNHTLTISQPSSQMMSVIAQAPPMSTPASVIQHPPSASSPQPSVPRQTATPPPPPPSQSAPGQLTAQEMVVRENEQFAASFLRSTYENIHGFKVEQSEVYNKYLSACAKAGRKGVIAPHHFPKVVRTVFGVTTVPVVKPVVLAGDTTPSGVSKQHFYEGIKVRPKPIPIIMEGTESVAIGVSPIDKKKPLLKPKKPLMGGTAPIVSSTSSEKNADLAPSTSLSSSSTVSSTTTFTPTSSILLSQLSAPPKPKDTPSTPENTNQVAQRQRMQQQQQQPPVLQTTNQSQPEGQPQIAQAQMHIPVSSPPPAPSPTATVSQPPPLQVQQPQPEAQTSVQASSTVTPQQPQQAVLLQQQLLQTSNPTSDPAVGGILASAIVNHKGKAVRVARINGARNPTIIQIQGDNTEIENHIGSGALQGRRDPPQPAPPPPLAPLSSGSNRAVPQELTDGASVIKCTNNLITSEENSTKASNQTSEGVLVNGAAHLEIKSEIKEESPAEENTKPMGKGNLMLADLLEKSVDVKEPPVLNGGLSSKDLCISERGLELVSKGSKTDLGKQIRITERGIEVVDTTTGGCDKDLSGMELRLTERGLELVDKQSEAVPPTPVVQQDNVLQKELSVGEKLLELLEKQDGNLQDEVLVDPEGAVAPCIKRPAGEDLDDKSDVKRLKLEVNGNGSNSGDESSQGSEEKVKASSAAANLYSALAASVLEDEDPDLLMEQAPQPTPTVTPAPLPAPVKEEPVEIAPQPQVSEHVPQIIQPQPQAQPQLQLVQSGGTLRQVYVSSDPNQSAPSPQVMMAGTRQIIVSQALTGQNPVLITAGGSIALQGGGTTATTALKTSTGQTVLMQTNTGGGVITGAVGRPTQYVISNQGQQLQLVQGGNQLQLASGTVGGQQFVMAQPQTALIQGQPQTVLVAQTPQQQGTAAKTIIILQQQPGGGVASQQAVQQKLVAVTPQGQQVVVTPVQRPVIQSGAVSHAAPPALVAASQQPSPAPSPAPATTAPTGIPTPVLTANPSPVQTPAPSPIPTPTITANPNASGMPRPNVVRPSPTPSPNSLNNPLSSKPNGVVSSTSLANPTRIGTRSSIAKSMTQNTVTTASAGPASPAATPSVTPVNSLTPKPVGSNTPPRVGGMPSPVTRPVPNQSMYLCEWRGCMRSFKSANEVYMHACETHCPSGSQEIQCLWERCDAMKRKRFSLMTHLFDRHCNAEVLRMMAVRRRQLSQSGRSEIPPPQPPPPHPGYAPNAAFHAIKRHALEFVNPKELLDDNEGPVTKSIRLTAALILRNLVIYSNSGRRLLRSHEPHLASVALSNVESSRTVAQVLYDMNHATNR